MTDARDERPHALAGGALERSPSITYPEVEVRGPQRS